MSQIQKSTRNGVHADSELPCYTQMDSLFSQRHNVTIFRDDSLKIRARQVNNEIAINPDQEIMIHDLMKHQNIQRFNIAPKHLHAFTECTLAENDIILDPIPVVLVSSYGLLGNSKWTSSQPSEGIWVLAEWLSRVTPVVAPICIDPNLIHRHQYDKIIEKLNDKSPNFLFGFSVLPVNLENDAELICRSSRLAPQSFRVVGGIGSESLSMLPVEGGEFGLENALPVDIIIPGVAIYELVEIVTALYEGMIKTRNDLRDFTFDKSHELYKDAEADFTKAINWSREMARSQFIPFERSDMFHENSYKEANKASYVGDSSTIVSVLTDNQCSQGCYFCASPKQRVFANTMDASEHVKRKSIGADILAFNNNDLANDPRATIELCNEMIRSNIAQPKHGKMRVVSYEPELIITLARANFVRIAVGIESFSEEVRNRLGKRSFTEEAITKTLDHLLAVGIRPEINLILFSPHESIESLRVTTCQAVEWVNKGATIYATFGLFATPNSPGTMKWLRDKQQSNRIEYRAVKKDGMTKTLFIPHQWRASSEIEAICSTISAQRTRVIDQFERQYGKKLSVPIEAYIAIALLGHHFSINGYSDREVALGKIDAYLRSEIENQYISI
ncbi:MAG: hypothetical protein H6642_18635 [Caldilineaceae bacterium]|nr:hypothetical protein [Caldilineaceae bacterium]